jgi:hypothetical protein
VTVQRICKIARDENEVRQLLDEVWENPRRGEEILAETERRNREIYEFERMLEESGE